MAKSLDAKKNEKKKPTMTLKEKRQAKKSQKRRCLIALCV